MSEIIPTYIFHAYYIIAKLIYLKVGAILQRKSLRSAYDRKLIWRNSSAAVRNQFHIVGAIAVNSIGGKKGAVGVRCNDNGIVNHPAIGT